MGVRVLRDKDGKVLATVDVGPNDDLVELQPETEDGGRPETMEVSEDYARQPTAIYREG